MTASDYIRWFGDLGADDVARRTLFRAFGGRRAPAYNLANFMRTLAPPETGIHVEAIGDLAQVRALVLAHLHRVGS
jgi:hypothetical protein